MASTMTLSVSLTTPLTHRAPSPLDADAPIARVSLFRGFPTPLLSFSSKAFPLPLPRPAARPLAVAQAYDQETSDVPAGGSKLYVGNLPWNVDSTTLAEIFQDAGAVEEVEVMCDRDTGRSRGFAFVVMSTPEDAQAAIERFDGSDLGGRVLRVNFPSPVGQRRVRAPSSAPRTNSRGGPGGAREDSPNKLYVGNLSWGVDDLALKDLFAEFGKVLEARVVTDRDTGRSKGFGFVTLSNPSEVNQAVSNLDGAEFDGRQLRVNIAGQKP